jgi:hypothetical protein
MSGIYYPVMQHHNPEEMFDLLFKQGITLWKICAWISFQFVYSASSQKPF